jgi:hypothetical protein
MISSAGLGTMNHCAVEDQQKFSGLRIAEVYILLTECTYAFHMLPKMSRISVNNINQFVFIIQIQGAFCQVGTKFYLLVHVVGMLR